MAPGTGHMIRDAIYTRQSVSRDDDPGSCDVQFMTCREFARAEGEPGLHWTGQRFDDEGCSGATLDRPAMRRLRKVIDLGGIDRLYAVALDRLTRNMRDAVVLLDEFERAGVELRLVHQPELTSGPETRFIRHVLAAFAEFERDMIAARIADSRAYLKGHGRRLAGKVPYGYDADPVTRQRAAKHGVHVHLCGCKNPDLTAERCHLTRAAAPQQTASTDQRLLWDARSPSGG